jgi:hypothetical protein
MCRNTGFILVNKYFGTIILLSDVTVSRKTQVSIAQVPLYSEYFGTVIKNS